MARPRSADKRTAILAAATRVIVTQGLSASTAAIAAEAGVANGSLFTYFETKADLFNQLYLELKSGMAAAALARLPAGVSVREQMFHVWSNWVGWAVADRDKRRALTQLGIADELTPATREAGRRVMAGFSDVLERSRAGGPMRDVSMAFVVSIMNALADATMDFIAHDPGNADEHSRVGFDAFWRVLA